MSLQWVLGRGLSLTPDKVIALCKAPFASFLPLLPLLLMAFLPAGVCAGPHLFPVGVPPPPNSAFLDRGTFVWGLDGEQGAFECLAEDWGHGEGQGLPRVVLHWPPAGLQATPNTIVGVGGGCRSQAGERVPWGVWRAGQGEGLLRSRLCWGQGERTTTTHPTPPPPPATSQQGGGRVGQGTPAQLHAFFMWVPWAISQSQALD